MVPKAIEQEERKRRRGGRSKYTSTNPGHILGAVAGGIYVASPIDVIPDFIPIVGYVDDLFVMRASTALGGWLWDALA